MGALTKIVNLPMPLKVGMFLASGGSLGMVLWMIPGLEGLAYVVWIVTALGAVVMSLLKLVFKGLDKRKAKPFEQKLGENAAAAPTSVSDPGRRARLDDLRKKFSEGVSTFKEHGKDIYSMPWYALVGEPGSGKTEAIRHCNVGFPPGLQDQLQGAGGTLNMNWWFTNHAVILDTAGRLMFEEVEPGNTSEWTEFLKLLRSARPNCPLNGMLLVIPADSLIKDDADTIERKGGKIAQQLDNIQRALGVRFPVFVLITKADLINGFREFFDDLNDPVLQHQMLGWTNPQPLDAPFDPEHVEQHLYRVRDRLLKRRMGLLMDPVHSEDQSGRRVDEVDALYAFPDSLVKIAPRLRVYLRMVFVQGAWSTKPLFLRGIYFTSSMREGDALDADLAEALGVNVEELPDGKAWTVDRAYFLRDLFINKIFRERGLVTRAANAKGQQKRRRLIVLGSGTLAVLLIALFTMLGFWHLRDTVAQPAEFWAIASEHFVLANSDPEEVDSERTVVFHEPVGRIPAFRFYEPLEGEPSLDYQSVHIAAQADIERGGASSPIFSVVALVRGDALARRSDAQRHMFESLVVRPVLSETAAVIGQDQSSTWNDRSTAALAELLQIQRMEEGGERADPADLGVLLGYLEGRVGDASNDGDRLMPQPGDIENLQALMAWTYGDAGHRWPPANVLVAPRLAGAGSAASPDELLRTAVTQFVAHWSGRATGTGEAAAQDSLLARLNELIGAADEFEGAEAELHQYAGFDPVTSVEQYRQHRQAWAQRLGSFEQAAERLGDATRSMGSDLDSSWSELRRRASTESLEGAREAYGRLFDAIGRTRPGAGSVGFGGGALGALGDRAGEAASGLRDGGEEGEDGGESGGSFLDRLTGGGSGDSDPGTVSWVDDELRRGLEAIALSVEANLEQLGERFASRQGGLLALHHAPTGQRLFEARAAAYARIGGALEADVATDGFDEAAAGLDGLSDVMLELRSGLRGDWGRVNEGDALSVAGREVTDRAADAIEGYRANRYLSSGLDLLSGSQGLGDFVSRRTDEIDSRDLLDRPRIPATQADAEYDRRYQPAAAADVIGLIGSMAGYADADGVLLLDEASVRDQVEQLAQEQRSYLSRYVEYWTDTVVDGDVEPQVPQAWSDLRNWYNLDDRTVNERFAQLDEQVLEALDAVRDELSDRDAARVSSMQALLREEISDIDGMLIGRIGDMKDEWERLVGQDVSSARIDVLTMMPSAFNRDYIPSGFVGTGEEGAPARRFWSRMVRETLNTFARQATTNAGQAIQTLNRTVGFPVLIDASNEMSPAEVARVNSLLGQIRTSGNNMRVASGAIGDPDESLGELPRDIADLLRELRNAGEQNLDDSRIDAIDATSDVVAALTREDDAPRMRFVFLPSELWPQDDRDSVLNIRFVELRVGDRSLGLVTNRREVRVQTDQQNVEDWEGGVEIPNDQPIQLVFYDANGSDLDAEPIDRKAFSARSRYAGLEPLSNPRAVEVDPSLVGGDSNVYRIPFEVSYRNGTLRYWLGVQIEGDIPRRRDWPTSSVWNDAFGRR